MWHVKWTVKMIILVRKNKAESCMEWPGEQVQYLTQQASVRGLRVVDAIISGVLSPLFPSESPAYGEEHSPM